jgi:1,2-diacylglycerol 3-alpha-glucosyltransferase
MNVVSIGTDRKVFEPESAVRARMIEYGKLFSELHIVVFSLAKNSYRDEQIAPNVWIYATCSKNRWRYIFDARSIIQKEFKDKRIDVITTQDPFETGLAGVLARRAVPAKLHMQIHTDFMSTYFTRGSWLNRIRVAIASKILPKADAVRAVSDRIKTSLAKIDPKLPDRTRVLPIYTDTSVFKDAPITDDLHKVYPQFSFIILMASRLTAEKNIGFALKLLREIVLKYKDVGMVIVGDGPEKKYLQGIVLRDHLDRNVVFEPWQSSLASYYHTADVFLTTSLYEGYGLTLVEAAASGSPIISSDVGVAQQIIESGKTGFICDLSQPETFSKALFDLIEQPAKLAEMKHVADKIAHEKASEPKAEYLKKYKIMLEEVQ